jgi:hypothetical protein
VLAARIINALEGVAESLVLSSLAMLTILIAINGRLGLKLDSKLSEMAIRIHGMSRQLSVH